MFERFTDRARQVVVLAQEEARSLKHAYIGSEHLLLGLVREEEGVAARVLGSLHITAEGARAEVVRMAGLGEEDASGMMPFTPRAKDALEAALRESLSLGHNYIGTEHILLGLVGEDDGIAARILLKFDADADKVRDEVIRALSGPGGRLHPTPAGRPWPIPRELLFQRAIMTGESRWLWTRLASEIQSRLGRKPDAGDLLLVLASVQEGLIARVLAELGVDDRALDDALKRARAGGTSSTPLNEQIEHTRRAKEQAIEDRQFERAAQLRDEERRLTELERERREQLLQGLRARLGIAADPGESRPDPS